jgi:hypothetical protein
MAGFEHIESVIHIAYGFTVQRDAFGNVTGDRGLEP